MSRPHPSGRKPGQLGKRCDPNEGFMRRAHVFVLCLLHHMLPDNPKSAAERAALVSRPRSSTRRRFTGFGPFGFDDETDLIDFEEEYVIGGGASSVPLHEH